VYQGFLFKKLLLGNLWSDYALKPYPVPYTVVTVAMGLLDFVVAPQMSAAVILCLTTILFVSGSLFLIRSSQTSRWNPLFYVPLLYTLNAWLFWGEISYETGLGVLFFYLGFVFRRLDTLERLGISPIVGYSCLLFAIHPIPWLVGAIVTAIVAIDPLDLRLATRIMAGYLPSAGLAAWYLIARFSSPAGHNSLRWYPWSTHLIAGRFIDAFALFPGFLPWLGYAPGAMSLAAVANIVACLVTLAVWIWCAISWLMADAKDTRRPIALAAIVCIAAFLTTGFAIGDWVGPGERFMYPATWLALAWLASRSSPPRYDRNARFAGYVLFSVIIAQAIYVNAVVSRTVGNGLSDAYRDFAAAKSEGELCDRYRKLAQESFGPPHRRGLAPFIPNHPAVVRMPYYLYIDRDVAAPIFQVGLFAYSGPGDNENLCPQAIGTADERPAP